MRALVLIALFSALACSKQEPPAPSSAEPTPSAAPAASPAAVPSSSVAAAPSAAASAGESAQPPTEEDFEDEASQAVTAKTLDSQLDALEKEIQAD